jgi:protein TonB
MGADRLPSILSSPKPPYPREAFRARQEGRVTVDIEVLSDGKVGRTALNATSGVPSLDASALEAIRNWQYAPGTKGGKLSPQWIRVVVSFELKNR